MPYAAKMIEGSPEVDREIDAAFSLSHSQLGVKQEFKEVKLGSLEDLYTHPGLRGKERASMLLRSPTIDASKQASPVPLTYADVLSECLTAR